MENITADIQPDGAIRFQVTVEKVNHTGSTIRTEHINGGDMDFELFTDESGQPLQFTKRPGRGRPYLVTLNKPVPPGGKESFTMEGTTAAGAIKPDKSGVCDMRYSQSPGTDMRIIEVWRLPPGATFLGKDQAMQVTTNADQIELRVDETVPPNVSFAIGFRYRLPTNAASLVQ